MSHVAAPQPETPAQIAEHIASTQDTQSIRSIIRLLDKRLAASGLERFTQLWDLSGADAARIFGVSRQAFTKWLHDGPPLDRAAAVAALEDTTDVLTRYIKRDRIPVVVRRPADMLGGASLLQLIEKGQFEEALRAARSMLDLRRIQA
jgi:hypothetical protein